MSRWPYRPDGLKSIRIDIDPVEMRRCTLRCRRDRRCQGRHARAARGRAARPATARPAAAAPRSARRRRRRSRRSRRSSRRWRISTSCARCCRTNAIVTDELSQVGFASWYGFPIYEPRTFITSGYQGTLGSGFPTALGAKVANPDKPVVAITGDGGFMFGVQELVHRRAVQHRRGDAGVQQQRLRQCAARPAHAFRRPRGGGRSGQSGFRQARGILWRRRRRASPRRIISRPALEKALAHGGPYLIAVEVPTGFRSHAVDVHSSGEAVTLMVSSASLRVIEPLRPTASPHTSRRLQISMTRASTAPCGRSG